MRTELVFAVATALFTAILSTSCDQDTSLQPKVTRNQAGTAAGQEWRAPQHYEVLDSAPSEIAGDSIEVLEFFWYGCPHCYALDPLITLWDRHKPGYIRLRRVPLPGSGGRDAHARLFHALEAMNRRDLHVVIFDAIHRRGLPLSEGDAETAFETQLTLLSSFGIPRAPFLRLYFSGRTDAQLTADLELAKRYKVASVPLFVVNGRYVTSVSRAGGQDRVLVLVSELVAMERRRMLLSNQ